jgi:microcompartment protein CcmK/EutM
MQIAKVVGNVVSTHKTSKLQGLKLLLVVPMDLTTFEEKGQPLVAIDTVGAGVGEIVMLCGGSSSRLTELTEGKPSDLSIIAIIDFIEYEDKMIFQKYPQEND